MVVTSDLDVKAKEIAKWLKSQPHLPDAMDTILIKRYIYSSESDLERTKALLHTSLAMRTKNHHIFMDRDPMSPEAQIVFQTTDMVPLPVVTKDNHKLFLYRLADYDPSKYDFNETIKVFFMISDIRMITPDENGIAAGEVPIYDMNGMKLKHVTKIVLSTLRIYMKYTQEAHPVRLKQIHIINCSAFLDRVVSLIKPFIKSEVFKMIRFHQPNSTTLDEFVPKDLLPNDYGGKVGYVKDLKQEWQKRVEQHREYLINRNNWLVTNDKNNNSNNNPPIVNSFSKLEID